MRANAIALMRRHSSTVTLDENVSPSLVRKTFQAAQPQLFLDFISSSFPTLYFHNRFRAGSEPGFAEFIVLNFGQDAYMDTAICCLSSVYLAHLTQDPVLLRTSRRMYGVSLSELIRALSKDEHALSDNMLCTAMRGSCIPMLSDDSCKPAAQRCMNRALDDRVGSRFGDSILRQLCIKGSRASWIKRNGSSIRCGL